MAALTASSPVCSVRPAHETVRQAIRRGAAALAAAGIAPSARESRYLLAAALGRTAEALLRDHDATVPVAAFDALLARRAAREPLALILGRQEFWSLDLAVSAVTLVPRADSETLIEAALAAFPDRDSVSRVLDLGTGTGALLLAALREFPRAWGLGIDRIPAAAALAAANAHRLGVETRAAFAVGDWDAGLSGAFDLVLANPPYIPSGAVAGLMPEVAGHEPRSALDGGTDGLDAYRRILDTLPDRLGAMGVGVLELGEGQGEAVSALAAGRGLAVATVRPDLGGIPRAMVLRPGGAMQKLVGIVRAGR